MIQKSSFLIPKGLKSGSGRGPCTPRAHCGSIHNSQDVETTLTSMGRCLDEENKHNGISALKEKGILYYETARMTREDTRLSDAE